MGGAAAPLHLGTPRLRLPRPGYPSLAACCVPSAAASRTASLALPTHVPKHLHYRSALLTRPALIGSLLGPRRYRLHSTAQHSTAQPFHIVSLRQITLPGRHPSLTHPCTAVSIYIISPVPLTSRLLMPSCPYLAARLAAPPVPPCVTCHESNQPAGAPKLRRCPCPSVLLHSPDQCTRLFPRAAQRRPLHRTP